MRNLILTMAEHQEQGMTANRAQNNGNQMNSHKTSFHVSIHELRWRWVKSNKYPMEMKTTTKPDFYMTHSETKSRVVSLSNHSKENEEDSNQTWIIKLSTKSSNSQKRERDYIPTKKNKAFMAAIPFPSPSSCLQLAFFQFCYLASPLKPTNLLPKYLTPLAKTPPWTSPPFQQNFSCSSLTASMPNERSSLT